MVSSGEGKLMKITVEFEVLDADNSKGRPTHKEILSTVKDVLDNAFNQYVNDGEFEVVDTNGNVSYFEFTEPELNLYTRDRIAGKWDWKANA